MASVVFNGQRKITFTVNNSNGQAAWSLTVANGSSSATRLSTGPIELWIGSTHLTTSYSGTYSNCADSSYNSWNHSVNFQSGNSSSAHFPATNGTISGTVNVGAGTHTIKMYVDYCYSNQKWTGTDSVTIGTASKDMYISVNSGRYMEVMSKSVLVFPTWSEANGQDDILWINVGAGSWDRGGINYPYANGHTHSSAASLDDIWNTHIYTTSTQGLGSCRYFPRIYIKYNANGGSSTPATQTKYMGNGLTLANAISRAHYSFAGWAMDSTSGTKYNAGTQLAVHSWNSLGNSYTSNSGWGDTIFSGNAGNTVTMYATWTGNKYTVAYYANGGTSTPSTQTITYPGAATLAKAISKNNASSTSNGTITIKYNVNGGNSTAPGNSTGTYTNTTTTKYTFEKWHLNSASGTGYAAGASYSPSSNVTMYAGWTSSSSTARTTNPSIKLTSTTPTKANTTVSSYKVTYNANGGSSTPAEQTATKTRKYTFSKWNSKSDGTGTDYSGNTSYTFSADATLYAKYTSSDSGGSITLPAAISRANGSTTGYTITYNANGGTGAPASHKSGNRVVTYKFDKWAEGSTSGTKYAASASYTPSAAKTMYATWTSTTASNSSFTPSTTIPTRECYKFLGWAKSATATTPDYIVGTSQDITSNLTLYAVWKEDQTKLKIKVDNAWKTGKAYFKKDGSWVKVVRVYTKVNGEWKIGKIN